MAEKSPSHQLELELATSNRQANKSTISRLHGNLPKTQIDTMGLGQLRASPFDERSYHLPGSIKTLFLPIHFRACSAPRSVSGVTLVRELGHRPKWGGPFDGNGHLLFSLSGTEHPKRTVSARCFPCDKSSEPYSSNSARIMLSSEFENIL